MSCHLVEQERTKKLVASREEEDAMRWGEVKRSARSAAAENLSRLPLSGWICWFEKTKRGRGRWRP